MIRHVPILLLMSMSIFLGNLAPHALSQEVISYNFDKQDYYQGDDGALILVILNNHPDEILTERIYLQTYWKTPLPELGANNVVHAFEGGGEYRISSGQNQTFRISFNIPTYVETGPLEFHVFWIGEDTSAVTMSNVTLLSGFINIRDRYERAYYLLRPLVMAKFLDAEYRSAEAKSMLIQGSDLIKEADIAANKARDGELSWSTALDKLKSGYDLLGQASEVDKWKVEEETRQQLFWQRNFPIFIGIGAATIGSAMVLAIARKRRRRLLP